jgi:hypothetical protein
MVPSLDAADPRVTTIDEGVDTRQRDPRSMARSAQVIAGRHCELARPEGFRRTRCRFSRRLQLDPGLMPPTSWSLPLHGAPRSIGARSWSKVQVLAVI